MNDKDNADVLGDRRVNFMLWRTKIQKNIAMHSWKTHSELSAQVAKFLAQSNIKAYTCYDNAMRLSLTHPNISYVLGRVTGDDQTVDHAWNVWNGIHFDITRETFAPACLDEFHWQQFVILNSRQLRELASFGLAPCIYDVFTQIAQDSKFRPDSILNAV